jgi:L-lactate dehydrogenase
VNGIIGRCRAAAPVPGVDSVRIPGENALARKRAALADGVALYPGIYAALEKLAQRFALPPPPAAGR